MTGLVLCGGQSRRMGKDKGLLLADETTFAEKSSILLSQFFEKILVSINEKQEQNYLEIFDKDNLVQDNKTLQVKGPLLGVLSAFLQNKSEPLLVLACDLIDIQTFILKNLLDIYFLDTDFDFYVYQNDEEPEPLCGIYTANGLTKIVEMYHSELLLKHSMKYVLASGKTKCITLPDNWKPFFRNVNSPEDLHD